MDRCRTNTTTHFFREPRALALVRDRLVRPRLASGGAGSVSVWCAGCSTGDEPYSLIITGLEAGGGVDVLATDINPAALRTAELGAYAARHLRHVAPPTRARFFEDERGSRFRVREEVRARVRFRSHDLTREPAPGHGFDVVLCRNVMVYFNREEAQRAVATMAAALRPGGWLIIGASEWLSAEVRAASPAAAALELEELDGVMVYRRRPLVMPTSAGEPAGAEVAVDAALRARRVTLGGLTPMEPTTPVVPDLPIARGTPVTPMTAVVAPATPTPAGAPAPGDDFVAHLRRAGDALLDVGRCPEARTRYSDALARDPLVADLHLRIALSWMHDDSQPSAVSALHAREALRQCLFLAPKLWPAWLLYAETLAPTESGAAVTALEVASNLLDSPSPEAPPPELAGFLGDPCAAREAVARWLRLLERERPR